MTLFFPQNSQDLKKKVIQREGAKTTRPHFVHNQKTYFELTVPARIVLGSQDSKTVATKSVP